MCSTNALGTTGAMNDRGRDAVELAGGFEWSNNTLYAYTDVSGDKLTGWGCTLTRDHIVFTDFFAPVCHVTQTHAHGIDIRMGAPHGSNNTGELSA